MSTINKLLRQHTELNQNNSYYFKNIWDFFFQTAFPSFFRLQAFTPIFNYAILDTSNTKLTQRRG